MCGAAAAGGEPVRPVPSRPAWDRLPRRRCVGRRACAPGPVNDPSRGRKGKECAARRLAALPLGTASPERSRAGAGAPRRPRTGPRLRSPPPSPRWAARGAPRGKSPRGAASLGPAAPCVSLGFCPVAEGGSRGRSWDPGEAAARGAECPPAALKSAAPASGPGRPSAPRLLVSPSPQPTSSGLPQAERAPRLPTGSSRADSTPHGCKAPSVRLLPSASTESQAPG